MTKLVAPFPIFRAFATTGEPLAGGKLYTYAANTLTPLATYTDETGGTPNLNPVVLDDTGSANVWLSTSPYKFVLTDADDVPQWTADNIGVQPPSIINVVNYGAVGDGTTDDQPAFAAAAAAAGSWGTVLVPRPAVSYKLGSNVSASEFWILMGGATISSVGTLGGLTIQQVNGGTINIGGTTFVITNTGDVGIGTDAPAEKLDIVGNINFPDVTGSPNGQVIWNSGGAGGSIDFGVTVADMFTFSGGGDIQTDCNTLFKMPYTVVLQWIFSNSAVATISVGAAQFYGTATNLSLKSSSSPNNDFSLVGLDTGGSSTSGIAYLVWNYLGGSFNSGGAGYPVISVTNHSKLTLGGFPAASGNSSTTAGMMIESVGNSTNNDPWRMLDEAAGSSSATMVKFYRGNFSTTVGSITTTNSATAFNTSSDYRLKDVIAPISGALAEVEKLPAYLFKWKINGVACDGFLAHEVQDIAPYAVQGEKDGEDWQQLDYSKLVPLLWAAVQELSAKVKQLENKNA